MTPAGASVTLLLAQVLEATVLADTGADIRHSSPATPPRSDPPDSLPAPVAASRKCGHQPLPLDERLRRAAELGPALSRIRHSREVANSWPTTRRRLHSSDGAASSDIVIDVYWHIVAGSGAQPARRGNAYCA